MGGAAWEVLSGAGAAGMRVAVSWVRSAVCWVWGAVTWVRSAVSWVCSAVMGRLWYDGEAVV